MRRNSSRFKVDRTTRSPLFVAIHEFLEESAEIAEILSARKCKMSRKIEKSIGLGVGVAPGGGGARGFGLGVEVGLGVGFGPWSENWGVGRDWGGDGDSGGGLGVGVRHLLYGRDDLPGSREVTAAHAVIDERPHRQTIHLTVLQATRETLSRLYIIIYYKIFYVHDQLAK